MTFKHHRYYLILLISICLFIVACSTGKYSIYRTAILNYYPKGGYEHIVDPVKEIDPLVDKDIIVYIALQNRWQTYNIVYKIYKPDGSLFSADNHVMIQKGPYNVIYDVSWIKSITLSAYPGEWRAEIYVDGMFAKNMNFNLIERRELIEKLKRFVKGAKYYQAGVEIQIPKASSMLSKLGEAWQDKYGVVIEKVLDNSPAEKGGLLPGDIILEINDDKIYSTAECVDAFAYSENPYETKIYIYRPTINKYLTKKIRLELIEEAELLFFEPATSDFNKYTIQGHNQKLQ